MDLTAGAEVRTAEWDLQGADMVTVVGPSSTLPADKEIPKGRAQDLARNYGLLLALVTDEAAPKSRIRTDSAAVAVYRRRPERLPGQEKAVEPAAERVRDHALSRLHLADADRTRSTFPAATLAGGREALRPVCWAGRSTAGPFAEAAARAARIQLELLDASDEYSRIASTQYRADEIAARIRVCGRPTCPASALRRLTDPAPPLVIMHGCRDRACCMNLFGCEQNLGRGIVGCGPEPDSCAAGSADAVAGRSS